LNDDPAHLRAGLRPRCGEIARPLKITLAARRPRSRARLSTRSPHNTKEYQL